MISSRGATVHSDHNFHPAVLRHLDLLRGRKPHSLEDLAKGFEQAVADFEAQIHAAPDGAEDKFLLHKLTGGSRTPDVDEASARRMTDGLRGLLHKPGFKDFETYINRLLKHAEIKILPTQADPSIARPALIIDRSYYQDTSLRNFDLIQLARILAEKFGFTDIHIPDLDMNFDEDSNEITAIGGYKTLTFLDFDDNGSNGKETLNNLLYLYRDQSAQIQRLFDYGKAQLFHSEEDTFVVVNFPSYERYEELTGYRFRNEGKYQDFIDSTIAWFKKAQGDGNSIILLRDFENDKANVFAHRAPDSFKSEKDCHKKALLEALSPDTPKHVVDLLYNLNWFHQADEDSLIMLPTPFSGKAYQYDLNDALKLARFFSSESGLTIRSFQQADLEDPHINQAFFANDT